jgi:hypothetical protein
MPFTPRTVGLLVESIEQYRVKIGYVCVYRYQVLRKITVDEGARSRVDDGLLEQGIADPESHAADQLRSCRFGIQKAAGRKYTQHPPETNLGRIGIDINFGEMGAIGVE